MRTVRRSSGGQGSSVFARAKSVRALTVVQKQHQQTEAWYRSILRSAPDGMLVMDGHGVIVQTNAQLETLFGYEEKELIGSHVEMLLPAAIRDMHGTKQGEFVASGCLDRTMASTLNLRGCHKNGSEFPVEIRLSQLPDIAGKVGAICAVIRDITERKCMEDALHAREYEFRALVENSPDAVLRYDLDCRCIYVNPAVERMTGIAAATLLGKTPIEGPINDVSLGEKQLACIRRVLATGVPSEIELTRAHADGAPHQYHLHFVPEHGPGGQVTSVLAVGRDISAHKLTEKILRDSRDIVRALAAHQETKHENERKELAYKIHEDLAQNLAALRMNISLLKMSGESAPHSLLLETMHDITDRSITRIRDIVSVLRPTVLDLGLIPALRWLIKDFKGFGFQFDLALQEEMLISDEASTLLFRAAQEAMLNIALHAAATHIYVSLVAVADVCRLVIRDNGCGFDPIAPRREGRFGLIRLTEQFHHMGGDLSIDSTPNQGTTLEILVPGFAEDALA
jgi:PAS domain S-box-containing protein